MKLIIVRHGDPDYEHDTLTEHGWKEAELLVNRFLSMNVKNFYVSPLGRARDTASCTLKALNRTAEVCDWLREFPAELKIGDNKVLAHAYPDAKTGEDGLFTKITWDVLPSYWTEHPEYFDREAWKHSEIAANSDIVPCYDYVITEFDKLLAKHGYERCGNYYKAVKANRDTIVFFCHFGLECVLLSHLMGISPFILWHSTVMAPTSVTTIYTEEREKGVAYFRAGQIGDVSHLYTAGLEPSFSARFCETYDSWHERH